MKKFLILAVAAAASFSCSLNKNVKVKMDSNGAVYFSDGSNTTKLGGTSDREKFERGEIVLFQGETSNGVTINITDSEGTFSVRSAETFVRPYMVRRLSGTEQWFLNFRVTSDAGADSSNDHAFTITGVDVAGGSTSVDYSCTCKPRRSGGGLRSCDANWQADDANVIGASMTSAALTHNRMNVDCASVPLDSKPTWVP